MVDFEYDYVFNVVIIGDSGVGKTSLLSRFCDDTYESVKYKCQTRTICICDKNIKIYFWDVNEDFLKYDEDTPGGIISPDGVLFVYDITDRISYINLHNWIREMAKRYSRNIVVTVIGNKNDISEQREVFHEEGKSIAQRFDCNFLETSAISGTNVHISFVSFLTAIYSIHKRKSQNFTELTIKLKNNDSHYKTRRCQC